VTQKAIQDAYPDQLSYCYGCGRLNEHGHQIKSYWESDEMVCHFTPKPYHTAIPGYVYGGLIASLIDCHSTGSAAAALAKMKGLNLDIEPAPRFVTASLKVDYLRPTPLGPTLELRAKATEITERKVIVQTDLLANGDVCAKGVVVAVLMPENLVKDP